MIRMSSRAHLHPSFFLLMSIYFQICMLFVSGSVLKVENGAYKRITVQVKEDISKCHCDQIIENLQVG